ncbi:MAG: S41 family peptidase [Phycisphaerae bacterium]|nr:S41 family peptidase [Phycisphaerae bacterium]
MRSTISRFVPPVLLTIVLGVLFVRLPLAAADRATDYALFDPIVDVNHLISEHFFKELDADLKRKMQEGAINGMIEALDDPYTEYVPSRELAEFDKEIRGEYAGIGAQVNTKDGFLQIVSPMEDTPAYRLGIEADDLVVAVDGVSVFGMTVDGVVRKLTGEAGTKVNLTIQRVGDGTGLPPTAKPATVAGAVDKAPGCPPGSVRFDLEVVREKIVASTVKGIHREGDKWSYLIDPVKKIGYIRVTQFTAGTIPELASACKELVSQGLQGLILDLRFNGGGSLFAAIQMADLFLKEGVIVSTKGRTTQEEKVYAREAGTLPEFPMVVVMNAQSASASEVVAGALADNDRAVILGERSFGKGIVQTLYRLPSGAGQLKVTEQYYYLPSGRCLQRQDDSAEWGVDPTPGFYVPMTNTQYREMLRVRRAEEIIRKNGESADAAKAWSDPQWILEYLKDPQLSAAVKAIVSKVESGEWVPTGENAPKGTLEQAEMKREERRYELLLRELARTERRMQSLSDATGAKTVKDQDLIPGEVDLTGGVLEIKDKDGKVISTLKITGDDLEAWLTGAPVEPEAPKDP